MLQHVFADKSVKNTSQQDKAQQSARPAKETGRSALRWSKIYKKGGAIVKRLVLRLFLTSLLLEVISGCGGGQSDTSVATKTSPLVVYQFTATIDSYVDSWAPFPAAVGDIITGTFIYDPNVVTQKAPAGVQVKIGTTTLTSDLTNFNYPINISNDNQPPPLPDGSPSNKIDMFSWQTVDTQVATQYGLDYIGTVIGLEDTTGSVFTDSKVPANLVLNKFNFTYLLISKEVHGVGGFGFCNAHITSLLRLQ